MWNFQTDFTMLFKGGNILIAAENKLNFSRLFIVPWCIIDTCAKTFLVSEHKNRVNLYCKVQLAAQTYLM